MKVTVYATYDSVEDKVIKDRLVVVVDVLRATSTISPTCQWLQRGNTCSRD